MSSRFAFHYSRVAAFIGVAAPLLAAPCLLSAAPPAEQLVLAGHVPTRAIATAHPLGRVAATAPVSLAITLHLRNQQGLTELLERLYDPNDEIYGMYLTPAEFAARFAPTQTDYQAVIDYAQAHGLTVTHTHSNHLVLDVTGPAKSVEGAFGVRLQRFLSPEGREFRAPDREPALPVAIGLRVQGVAGLDTAAVWRPRYRVPAADPFGLLHPLQIGSGPNGGLTPGDIKNAYNLNTTLNGTGQTLGLFELDGYKASDITSYESYFGLPAVPLQNVLVDGYNGAAGSGAGEVTLDIELQIALAPKVSKLYVYEGPNSSAGVIDTYNRIATDNLAKSVSTSWGLYESGNTTSALNSENSIFQQMATQGQSIFAAAGDSGADDNGTSLSVDDPASQPYVTGVGGTTLTTVSAGGAWKSEKTWNGGSPSAGAGGGGISSVWSIPTYQSGVVSTASKGSTTKRNVPDVSLDADPNTGYAIYQGGWTVYGGTSCAAPLWSAFTALVNQNRAANGLGTLGFANTPLYNIGKTTSQYANDFHDIADGSTNLYYPAVTGYDLATGWGTFNGVNLLADLSGGSVAFGLSSVSVSPASVTGGTSATGTVTMTTAATANTVVALASNSAAATVPASVTVLAGQSTVTFTITTSAVTTTTAATITAKLGTTSTTATLTVTSATQQQQLLGNPGFETGTASPWVASAGVLDNSTNEPAHSGSWKAWLDGYGTTHTDTLYQTVTIPSTITTATLSFYLHIDTAETTKTTAYDTLKVQLRTSSGAVLTTLATYSNLNAASGYTQKTFNISSYKGQTVQVYLIGTEDSSLQTSFVVDDFSLTVQ